MNRVIAALALSLTATMVAHAQGMPTRFSNPYQTCHGTTVGLSPITDGMIPVVRGLDPRSPEGIAGMRSGDTIVTLNGSR
jgi:S1-C subfamily serine protease